MHTELARFPHVSGVPREVSWAQTEAYVSDVYVPGVEHARPRRHLRWNKILGLISLLGVSAGGWALIGLAIEKIVK
jgi:hypothetical protein